jgi:hypothetical protein
VKVETVMRRAAALVLSLSLAAFASANSSTGDKKEKPKTPVVQVVDSGSFGIFVKGQRVATETFRIEQENGNSVIKSQLKETDGADSVDQKSDLQISAKGELLRYEWSQTSGSSLTVFPENDFLKERILTTAGSKPIEQPFLLPSTSPILDNNFFIQREILAWKYLAIAPCNDQNGKRHCETTDFGTLVPQARSSISVRMELVGKEKVTIRGTERELLRLNLHGEGFDWNLWLDEHDQFKLVKVAIPADNTEVIRD